MLPATARGLNGAPPALGPCAAAAAPPPLAAASRAREPSTPTPSRQAPAQHPPSPFPRPSQARQPDGNPGDPTAVV
jgi:hypothetical protein